MITAVPLPEPWTDTERLAAGQIEALRDHSITSSMAISFSMPSTAAGVRSRSSGVH